MKLYRFSPIRTKQELLQAIEHVHFMCFELCYRAFGEYLPAAGNIGIFCHYDDEFEILTKIRQDLTSSENWNEKYYRLHKPIVIEAKGGVPKTEYTYLYIRKPDPYRAQVGDVDLVLDEKRFAELKNKLSEGQINGIKIIDKPHLDMVELSYPYIDALAFITTTTMSEKGL